MTIGGFRSCIFETDAKQLAAAYNGAAGNSNFHIIVEDCTALCKHFDNVLVQYMHRSANGVC